MIPTFRGSPLVPTKAAADELAEIKGDLWLVKEVLERGYDCRSRERKEGELEMCLRKKNGFLKVVVARSHSRHLRQEVWVVVHVARFGGERT